MKVTVSFSSRKRNGHFHVVNIPIENAKVSCKIAKPEFEARRFHMSEIFRENSAGAPDLPPAIFYGDILYYCLSYKKRGKNAGAISGAGGLNFYQNADFWSFFEKRGGLQG